MQCEQLQREFEVPFEANEECQQAIKAAREAAIARPKRIRELKEAFEKSGRRHNSAEPEEVETLLM